jgi:hypothetical protein
VNAPIVGPIAGRPDTSPVLLELEASLVPDDSLDDEPDVDASATVAVLEVPDVDATSPVLVEPVEPGVAAGESTHAA